jgi:hypothetical protein
LISETREGTAWESPSSFADECRMVGDVDC